MKNDEWLTRSFSTFILVTLFHVEHQFCWSEETWLRLCILRTN